MTIYINQHEIPRSHLPGGGNWRLSGLTDVTTILGKNGSGKSILLRAWRDQNADGVHYVAPERTGEMNLAPHLLAEEMGGTGRRGYSTRNFVPEYRSRILGRIQHYFMMLGNSLRGTKNDTVPESCRPDSLERILATLTTDFSVELKAANPPYLLTRLATNTPIGNVDQLSSGEAQLLSMGLDILTIAAIWALEKRSQRVLLIDEPDAHIHPDLQSRFADFLLTVSELFSLQCVIATHSTSLLAAIAQFGQEKVSVIYMSRVQAEYKARRFDAITKELASCLGGHLLMGPLFGAPLLLVEGDDDFRIWSQVPRHHIINLAVIPCNGDEIKRYQLALERIFASLSEPGPRPIGFALLDGDKPLPSPNPDNPQRFVQFIRMNCREAENLYLTGPVLDAIGITWAHSVSTIEASYEAFGNCSERASHVSEWDRSRDDLKPLINNLAATIDPKNVPWTIRVGTTIGKQKPAGELAEFLGPTVIDALWPHVAENVSA